MKPVVTPEEMRAIDAAAPEPVEELIRRAGAAVAREAIDMLGGTYGRVVNVVAGGGNNGADGRDAAERLRRRGVKVRVFEASACPHVLPSADLVIDAAYGTGYRLDPSRPWVAPDVGGARILAVDIPSGVDGLTGAAGAGVLRADRTVTFQALKPGLLFDAGPALAGDVVTADIGLDTSSMTCHVVEAADVAHWWPRRAVDAHKWYAAVKVIAGSESMPGAAELCTAAALRGGSGLVSLSSPGCRPNTRSEVVQHAIGTAGFASAALSDIGRFGALVIGPGLGRNDDTLLAARECIRDATVPVVVDGDAIFAVAWSTDGAGPLLRHRELPTVVTPHDGEFGNLTGDRPPADRIAACRAAATYLDVHLLLKGPTTVIAAPRGTVTAAEGPRELEWASDEPAPVLLVNRGDQRLATAGSGDVLAGLIGAALAADVEPLHAAAAAAWIHAAAADLGLAEGLVAGDLVDLLPEAIGALR
jgi:NAD(P)H-hydrate repair Nnr-like enzyme with NAD(P)H-hydrate dehydratase domain/NAD(P)H-hydrate repair Nnr-like enzyme with NAD(P)H-hydrate epimerase domain